MAYPEVDQFFLGIYQQYAQTFYQKYRTSDLMHLYFVKDKGWASYNPALTKKNYNLVVNQLEENDICYILDNMNQIKEIEIQKISLLYKKEKTYNLSKVENNHNFFANGILVHNKSGQ